MKRKTALILLFLLLACGVFSSAESAGKSKEPGYLVLGPGAMLFVGDAPLSFGHTSSPEVVDWNNDKRMDIVVGTFRGGETRIFINNGTKEPKLEEGVALKAGNSVLSVGSG